MNLLKILKLVLLADVVDMLQQCQAFQ